MTSEAASEASADTAEVIPDQVGTSIIDQVRRKCLTRGFSGLKCFSAAFRQFDKDFSQDITYSEFKLGLQQYGVPMTEDQERTLFEKFDKDSSGRIDFQEFHHNLTPPLEGKRREVVVDVFNQLDANGDGVIQTADLTDLLSEKAKRHPKYRSGEWTTKDVLDSLISSFEQPDTKDGVVSVTEFLNYYSVVSSYVQEDAYFEEHLRNCWGVE